MIKRRLTQEVFYAIMRVTFTQILIMVALTSIVSAAPWRSGAREIPNRTISLNALTVSGTVVDENGETLPGVNVLEKGTTNGTTTTANGEFNLEVQNENSILVFSFIGYTSQEIRVGNQTSIHVSMEPDIETLQEVVVVGYGEQKKATLTGSVANIKGGEIAKSPSINVSTSLQGKLPGLVVNQRTGTPGSENLDILIRGRSTLNDNGILIVIDGVPRGNLEDLNPNDIESISVLKDASAAIYGSRAANGVILVTTKQGSKGAPSFTLTYNYAMNQPTQNPKMMDAATFAETYNEAEFYRQGRPSSGFTPFFSDAEVQKYRDGSDPILYPNTDWVKATTRNWAHQQNVNLQAIGGSDNVRYMLSFGRSDQEGNYINKPDHYTRYNTRVNVNADITDNLTVGANLSGIIADRNASNGTDFIDILQGNPTLPAVYPNGLLAAGRFRSSSLLSNQRGFQDYNSTPIQTTFTGSYKVPFVNGLSLDASFNYDLNNSFSKNFSKPATYYEYNVGTGEFDRKETQTTIELTDRYSKSTTSLTNFRINYSTTIAGDHNIKAMVGAEQERNHNSNASAYRKNFVSSAIPQINVGSSSADDQSNSGSAGEDARNSLFGRLNYDYQSKYLAEVLFRYDGSENFPAGNRYAFLPAISAGWRISEENFMDNLPFVNELKLRASYGQTGNDRVNSFQYLQAYQFGQNYVFGGGDYPGIYSSFLPNPAITWEVSKKLDVGLDATLWDRLLGFEFTVFKENRSNILVARNLSVAQIFGFPQLPTENIGEVDSHGYELTLTHQHNIRDVKYTINANVSFARSNIVFMDEVPPAEAYQAKTGHTIESNLYYKSDGIFNTQEEYDAYPHASGTQLGDIKIVDVNGDGKINGDDRIRIDQSATPEYVFGLTSNFQYKGFDLTLFFQGQTSVVSNVGGNGFGDVTDFADPDLNNNVALRAENRWTVDNQAGATKPRSDSYENLVSDFWLLDATFVRLKNLELGYSLGRDIASKVGLKDIRVFVSGTNLLTWSKDIKFRDPEIGGGFATYPPLRILNFGANIKF